MDKNLRENLQNILAYQIHETSYEVLKGQDKRSIDQSIDAIMALVETHGPEKWWICTDALARGGSKLWGPFSSQDLALNMRVYIEKSHRPVTYWVDQDTPKPPTNNPQ